MKLLCKLTAGAALAAGLAAGSLRATTFDFSYIFSDNVTVVTGTLDGTLSADGYYVDNVTNVSLFFNGTAAPGAVTAFKFDGGAFSSGPVVSFDVSKNDFIFASSAWSDLDFSSDSLFMFYISPVDGSAFTYYLPTGSAQDFPPVQASWSLSQSASAAVPDQGTTLGLIALSLIGLGSLRRRFLSARTQS